jgi:S-ribosylhomocysteine lyase
MKDIIKTKDIPEANVYQCGSCYMHSLKKAKKIAKEILKRGIGTLDNKKLKLKGKIPNVCNINSKKVKVLGK